VAKNLSSSGITTIQHQRSNVSTALTRADLHATLNPHNVFLKARLLTHHKRPNDMLCSFIHFVHPAVDVSVCLFVKLGKVFLGQVPRPSDKTSRHNRNKSSLVHNELLIARRLDKLPCASVAQRTVVEKSIHTCGALLSNTGLETTKNKQKEIKRKTQVSDMAPATKNTTTMAPRLVGTPVDCCQA